MDTLRQDLRFALRMARRTPGVTAVVVLSVALGIGCGTALFAVAYALLLRPLPFAAPAELQGVEAAAPSGAAEPDRFTMSMPDFEDVRAERDVFAEAGAWAPRFGLTFTGGEPEQVNAALVTAELFPTLGVAPIRGRQILPAEDRFGASPVILLGYDLWRRRFGGDPRLVGRTIVANGMPHRVIGVMPRGFSFPDGNEAWLPMRAVNAPDMPRQIRVVIVAARLRPGVSPAAADRAVRSLARRLARLHPDTNAGWSFTVRPLRRTLLQGTADLSLSLVLTAVVSLLLIACANAAGILLAHAAERRQEIGVRAALGAGAARLVQQLLTESMLLALTGGALGVLFGGAGIRLLQEALPLPFGFRLAADLPVLLAAFAGTLAAGCLFGLAPALRVVRVDLDDAFRSGGRSVSAARGDRRLHNGLVVAEVALSTVLIVAACLALRSLAALQATDPGVARDNLFTTWVKLPGMKYRDDAARAFTVQEIVRRIAAQPGIESAATTNFVPFMAGNGRDVHVQAEASPAPAGSTAVCYAAGSGFPRTLGARLVDGRDFSLVEGSTRSPAVLVGESLARQLWPGGHALGRHLSLSGSSIYGPLTVVGVVGDIKLNTLREDERRILYVSSAFNTYRTNAFLVRTALPRQQAREAVQRAVRSFDPDLPLYMEATIGELRGAALRNDRLFVSSLATLALIALFFAAVGTYAVLTTTVVRRRREIGIRLALGAPRSHLFRTIVGRGMGLTLLGLLLGLVAALPVARSLAGWLYRVSPTDPLSFGGGAILLLDVAFVACYLPARRALEVDPREALEEE